MIFFLPYVLAEIAAGLIWRFVYDGDYGLLASIARALGATAPHVLADPPSARCTRSWSSIVWKYFGFHMMLYIAGLQADRPQPLRRGRASTAPTRWQMLRYVKLPLLEPTIRLSVFFAILGSFQLFDLVMPLTAGGPSDSTQTMVSFLYNLRHHAHARRLRQRDRRGAVRHLRGLRLRLQARRDARRGRRCLKPTAQRPRRPRRRSVPRPAAAALPVLFLVAGLVLVPLAATVLGGFKDLGDLRANPFGLPRTWHFGATTGASCPGGRYWQLIFNSLVIAGFTTVADAGGRGAGGVRVRAPALLRRRASCSTTF